MSSKGLTGQDIEKVVCKDCVSLGEVTVEVTSEDSSSIQGRKRKFSDAIDAKCSSKKVSPSPKRGHTASSYDAHDHQYCKGLLVNRKDKWTTLQINSKVYTRSLNILRRK